MKTKNKTITDQKARFINELQDMDKDHGHLFDYLQQVDSMSAAYARGEKIDLEEVDITFLKRSQEFLKRHVRENPDQPFFLFHSTQAVHLPSIPGNAFKGKTNSGPHGDFIFELDYVVGELVKTLKELKVDDNTLFIFTSDNGPEIASVYHMRKDHSHDGAKPWRRS